MNIRLSKKLSKRLYTLILVTIVTLAYIVLSGEELSNESVSPNAETNAASFFVNDVVDGDTIKIEKDGVIYTVRLLTIDTPETKDPRKEVECYGQEASEKLKSMVLHKFVTFEQDSQQPDKDRYGRLLRYVYMDDGTLVNAVMVKEGYAFTYKTTPSDKLDEFEEYENTARASVLGLWSACPTE